MEDAIAAALRQIKAENSELQISSETDALRKYSRDQGAPDRPDEFADAVVFPTTVEHVQSVVRAAYAHRVPVVSRGAGTSVTASAAAGHGSLVVCLERMNRILQLSPEDEVAVVEPGLLNGDLDAAARQHGLMYAPDPASYQISTIGGNIATNAGGLRCAKYGVTRDSVLGLDVVLADGRLIRTGRRTFKGVAGYDLTSLLVGSEGTLGVLVGATVRLRHAPKSVRTLAVYFDDVAHAAAGVLAIGAAQVQPAITELLDAPSMADIDAKQGSTIAGLGGGLLLIQTDGYGADAEAEAITAAVQAIGGRVNGQDPAQDARMLDLRRQSRGAEVDNQARVGEDVAVPRSALVGYIAAIRSVAATEDVGLRVIAHAGDGNLHPTFWVADPSPEKIAALNRALDASVRLALDAGGTITGEHGVGQYKRRWLRWEQSEDVLQLQRRIKELFDPRGILNPGKAV